MKKFEMFSLNQKLVRPKILLLQLITGIILTINVNAQYRVEEVKVIFLEKFTRFIEWPEDANVSDSTKKFVLGVIGEPNYLEMIKLVYGKQKIKNKRVVIHNYTNPDEIGNCDMLFIGKSEKRRLAKIISKVQNKPILTIGDCEDYAEEGVMINLYLDADKVRFEINKDALLKAKLAPSYQLLNLARIVSHNND